MRALAAVIAIVCAIVGVLYLLGKLQVGASHGGPHPSHAILFFVLAVLALIWMRFQGRSPTGSSR